MMRKQFTTLAREILALQNTLPIHSIELDSKLATWLTFNFFKQFKLENAAIKDYYGWKYHDLKAQILIKKPSPIKHFT